MMNWKVRMKNPIFWLTVIPALVGLVYTILRALGIVPAIGQEDLESWIGTVITALTTLGVLVDPTTSGVGDSARAMGYSDPGDSDLIYDTEV